MLPVPTANPLQSGIMDTLGTIVPQPGAIFRQQQVDVNTQVIGVTGAPTVTKVVQGTPFVFCTNRQLNPSGNAPITGAVPANVEVSNVSISLQPLTTSTDIVQVNLNLIGDAILWNGVVSTEYPRDVVIRGLITGGTFSFGIGDRAAASPLVHLYVCLYGQVVS